MKNEPHSCDPMIIGAGRFLPAWRKRSFPWRSFRGPIENEGSKMMMARMELLLLFLGSLLVACGGGTGYWNGRSGQTSAASSIETARSTPLTGAATTGGTAAETTSQQGETSTSGATSAPEGSSAGTRSASTEEFVDRDEDGVWDSEDNCPDQPNERQRDRDGDGLGDVCDPDRDGDGIPNETDDCADVFDPQQEDADGDGTGDACQQAGMVYVPGGLFVRGACNETSPFPCQRGDLGYSAAAEANESPVRQIYLDGFWIDATEVTVAAFLACIEAGRCTPVQGGENCNLGREGFADHPINCVTWGQAVDYCRWVQKRLPTEAEWEKAARGGCEKGGDPLRCEAGMDDRKYPWGNAPPTCQVATFDNGVDGCGTYVTTPVGSKPDGDSPYGVGDMAGNVAEWVADWLGNDEYARSESDMPDGPQEGSYRVFRGGSWGAPPEMLRISLRFATLPTDAFSSIGFRCARSVP
ncbi:MAG: hypothetical protein D6812_07065 [Deltaproteobacteria bacterium]|nr:MAG: hypothetical protein D6812_07065 [Deltaproteobacteria bacterium]